MNTTTVVVLVVVWLSAGALSGVLMARRGYAPLWILLAMPLGPLFLPIALERIRRRPAVVEFGSTGAPPRRTDEGGGSRVLVGLDGSEQSDRALSTVLGLLGPRCALLVLAEVVSYDATEGVTSEAIDAAAQRLSEIAAGLTIAGVVHTEVLTGPAGQALRSFADRQDVDLLVVGRRGQGMSSRLLGSVSAELVQHSPVPVLVIGPSS